MKNHIIILFLGALLLGACKKSFLDAKPSSNIVNPTTLNGFQALLENNTALNQTGALPQMSSDEYFIVSQSDFDALNNLTYKGAYLWNKDLYGGETNQPDWNQVYKAVFYANSVLDGLKTIGTNAANQVQYNNIAGEALFFRAYAFFDLARNFSPVYNQGTATTDLGIPLRMSSGIDVTVQRSTLQQTFDQIIADLNLSVSLLNNDISKTNPNRPSRSAAYAMLARVYLYMGKYTDAGNAANECLKKYNTIIDYNKVDTTTETPFSYTTEETIFFSTQVYNYDATTGYTDYYTNLGVDTNLIQLYNKSDLRLPIFFEKNSLNNYNLKRGYVGGGFYAFTGLATDEVMLIKAECAARSNDTQTAVAVLNQLLVSRYKTGSYTPLTVSNAANALIRILLERRKELVWRALRWSDLKRYNRDGAKITLQRNLNGVVYTLPPNSSLYVFPIPDDEISLSGIKQNVR
ncbi:MAG: SusD family protein [Mucilaginibacter sp.]|nr:SusD family protein [Mucilaginibacter sp.]